MKKPGLERNPLLDSTVALLFRIHLLRGDCCEMARAMLDTKPSDERALDECARVEEALGKSYRILQSALLSIQRTRACRGRKAQ